MRPANESARSVGSSARSPDGRDVADGSTPWSSVMPRVSGSTELAVMLLDVLSGLPELNVAVAYDLDGQRITELPAALPDFERCRPIYETLPGWNEDLTAVRQWNDLPPQARQYVEFLSRQVGVPVKIVSVGPDRRQTILLP